MKLMNGANEEDWKILADFERADYTRIYDHEMRSVCEAVRRLGHGVTFWARLNRKHIQCDRSHVQTEQENASMSWVGKSSGNTISESKHQKCCLSECPINVQQCSINFLVPLSEGGYIVSKMLCFQLCRRTVSEERAQQPMSTLFR